MNPIPLQPPSLIERLAGIDLRSLAAFRIAISLILLWDAADALASAGFFFSDSGSLPRSVLAEIRDSPWMWSLHSLSGSVAWQIVLLAVQAAAVVCLLLGWRAQAAAFVAWLLLCSLHSRNPLVLHGGDTALRLLLFWSLFLPLGARWSLDERAGRQSVFAGRGMVLSAASLAALMQVCFIYWFTAALKYGSEWTRDGAAVYYALSIDQFARPAGRWLLQFPELGRALTFAVWWLEVLGPFAVFIPWKTGWWRVAAVSAFMLLHLGFAVCLRLGPFPFTMMAAWLLFLPRGFWDWLLRRRPVPPGSSLTACHRWMGGLVVNAFVLAALAFVLLWNLRVWDHEKWSRALPRSLNPAAFILRIDQNWALFAPRPLTDDGWMILEARLADGSQADLLRGGRPLSHDKPALISAEFRDTKWQKLHMSLWLARYEKARRAFCQAIVRQWNARRPPPQQAGAWTLVFMLEQTLPRGYAIRPRRVELAGSAAH